VSCVVFAGCCLRVVVKICCGCKVEFCGDGIELAVGGRRIPAIEFRGVSSSSVVGANPPDKIIITTKIRTGIERNMQITRHFSATRSGDDLLLRDLLVGSAN
jgi:hypothetical protein